MVTSVNLYVIVPGFVFCFCFLLDDIESSGTKTGQVYTGEG